MTVTTKEEISTYLTETILTIHNEVQSALDRINTTALSKGTELGKSTTSLSVQNLRVKVPLKLSLEVSEVPKSSSTTPITAKNIVGLNRKGLVINTQNQLQNVTKLKVALTSATTLTTKTANTTTKTANTETPKEAWGEIEITFSPIKRQ
ncbi:MAG: hypothetical protein LBE76_04515 [Nitrososphaerota archaeon]|jgi:hypothetical protein|nr:hypothetical protein [Nitrososphaerota archaeon]